MTLKAVADLADHFALFAAEHGNEVANALQTQRDHMREAADQAEATAVALTLDPPTVETPEGTISVMPTAGGMRSMVRLFTEAAESAQRAMEAWDKIADESEEAYE